MIQQVFRTVSDCIVSYHIASNCTALTAPDHSVFQCIVPDNGTVAHVSRCVMRLSNKGEMHTPSKQEALDSVGSPGREIIWG